MDWATGNSSNEEVLLASTQPKKRAGRKKFKETRHPIFRGVRRRNSDRWVCELRDPATQNRIWLGTYPTPEMAARAHDVAALALRGQAACLNFADSVWRLPAPASTDPKDIRLAAVQAAEAFRPGGGGGGVAVVEDEGGSAWWDEGGFDLERAAEGALMSPLRLPEEGWCPWDDDVESDAEVELWSYSF